MSSLIIKVTQNGSSQEYLYTKPGPIIIGSEDRSDLVLKDSKIEPRLLEVKVSGGNIFVKELSPKSQVYLDNVILPYRQEARYHEGSVLSLKDLIYQIQIYRAVESVEPPPFLEDDFRERLDRMSFKIKEKEIEIQTLNKEKVKAKAKISEMDEMYHRHSTEKSRLEVELTGLKANKGNLEIEVKRQEAKRIEEEQKMSDLQDFIKKLESEESILKEGIVAQNLVLTNLKDEREKRAKEVDHHRNQLTSLQLEARRIEEKVKELNADHQNQEDEIEKENEKIHKILCSSEDALKENSKIQKQSAHLLKEKSRLDHDVNELKSEVTHLENDKRLSQLRLEELKTQHDAAELKSRNILEEVRRNQEEGENLKNLNVELRAELIKAEEKLSFKKNQLNQSEFSYQDTVRKLATIQFDLERASLRLQEMTSEEKAQELKMLALRDELQKMSKRSSEEISQYLKEVEGEKYKAQSVLNSLKKEIEEGQKLISSLCTDKELMEVELQELEFKVRSQTQGIQHLDGKLIELNSQKNQAENQLKNLKTETINLEHDKNRAMRELSQIQIKLMDCEAEIKEKMENARVEIENYKREERAQIRAEKTVYMAEVEAFKQKSLVEVESEYRRKQDDIYQMKEVARANADEIIKEARKQEIKITNEAEERLKKATAEALEREDHSHRRIKEAQEYFKTKELEAEAILQKAKLDSREYIRKTDMEIQEDFNRRKQKIKKFLSMKQEKGLSYLKALNEQHLLKIKRNEQKGQQKIEDLKRREMKKVARIREDHLAEYYELKEKMISELKEEREKSVLEIGEMRRKQESELSQKKKSVLEHINVTKARQQEEWEQELKKEKEQFLRSKKDRIQNATQAVLNILTSEVGAQGEKEQYLKEKIRETIAMSIDGQNAAALNEVEQVLDLNPLKRKKMIPVLKKYALKVGIPAAVAIVMLADAGSIRSAMVSKVKDVLKQRESASELYVNQQKTEWKEKHTFTPATTIGYKPSYVENIIYTTDFEKVMENEEFQNDWILKVHDFMIKDLELSEDLAINFISSEGILIKELALARKDLHPQFLENGMRKMNDLEKTHLGWLNEKVTDPIKLQKFSEFRKSYFDKFYEEKFKNNRSVATEVK